MNIIVQKYDWLHSLLDFCLPPLCVGCGTYTEADYCICERCLNQMETFTHPFCLTCANFISDDNCPTCQADTLPLYAMGSYSPPLKNLIINYKFNGITQLSSFFAKYIYRIFERSILKYQTRILVPIPLHPSHEYYRGYNQATLFAKNLSEIFNFEVCTHIIKRIKKRKPQSRLSHKKRHKNVAGVFKAEKVKENQNEIILVDDVVTTGATIAEAKKILTEAGYKVKAVIAIAHAL